MALFITRVELLKEVSGDYEILHSAMAKEGFKRTILAESNVNYHLPPAEYLLEGEFDRQQILDKAKRAATTTKKEFRIIVTEAKGMTFYNLQPV